MGNVPISPSPTFQALFQPGCGKHFISLLSQGTREAHPGSGEDSIHRLSGVLLTWSCDPPPKASGAPVSRVRQAPGRGSLLLFLPTPRVPLLPPWTLQNHRHQVTLSRHLVMIVLIRGSVTHLLRQEQESCKRAQIQVL